MPRTSLSSIVPSILAAPARWIGRPRVELRPSTLLPRLASNALAPGGSLEAQPRGLYSDDTVRWDRLSDADRWHGWTFTRSDFPPDYGYNPTFPPEMLRQITRRRTIEDVCYDFRAVDRISGEAWNFSTDGFRSLDALARAHRLDQLQGLTPEDLERLLEKALGRHYRDGTYEFVAHRWDRRPLVLETLHGDADVAAAFVGAKWLRRTVPLRGSITVREIVPEALASARAEFWLIRVDDWESVSVELHDAAKRCRATYFAASCPHGMESTIIALPRAETASGDIAGWLAAVGGMDFGRELAALATSQSTLPDTLLP